MSEYYGSIRPRDAGDIFCLLDVAPFRRQLITCCGFGHGNIRTSSMISTSCCCVASLLYKLYKKASTNFVEWRCSWSMIGVVELVYRQISRGEGADLRLAVPATHGRNHLCRLLGRAIEDDRRRRRLHRRAFASASVEGAYYATIAIV